MKTKYMETGLENKNAHRIINILLVGVLLGIKKYANEHEKYSWIKFCQLGFCGVAISQVLLIVSDIRDLLNFKKSAIE